VRGGSLVAAACLALSASAHISDASDIKVTWQPPRPQVSDVALLRVHGPGEGANLEGSVGGRAVSFFRDRGGYAALVGFDMELAAGRQPWRIEIHEPGLKPRSLSGVVPVGRREFHVQRLTLPTPMVDLDPETERRATTEAETLRGLYRTLTPERLWRGPFARPVAGDEPGTGFGSRRIINGQPRSPHGGTDYAAPQGTPVVSVNDGQVALVADYFFQGRFVVVDHGLGLYTLYFHLDETRVEIGQRVARGQLLGTVGSTGRATGPHLHFGVHLRGARVDPARLLALPLPD
jgi:murein DD-endopeptidase MepM/ murein hydrolase activator NlpD